MDINSNNVQFKTTNSYCNFKSFNRFEHFGSDLKRTILNKFVTSACFSGIQFVVFGQSLNILRYFIGPLPNLVCFVKTVLVQSVLIQILIFADGIVVARYLYIFVLKNPFAFQDDFW